VPPGTVTFNNGVRSLGTATLNGSGVATLTLTPAVGSYSITASYGGSATDEPSASSPAIAIVVNTITTITTLTAFPTTSTPGYSTIIFGQTVTLTPTVAPASGATATGTVTFNNGGGSLGTANLNGSGVATLTLTPAVGTYFVTANYGGSSTDAASASSPPIVVTVNPISTTATLNAVPTSLLYGQTLSLTTAVTAASGASPTGGVSFYSSSITLGSATLNGSGVASITLTPAVGSYFISAYYGGSSTDAPSYAPAVTVNVLANTTTTILTASPNPASFGATVTFTATVSGAAVTPVGNVSFYDGPTLFATEALASGVTTYSTSALSVGSHNITASYTGGPGFGSSTSNLVVEVVSPADFSISAAPSLRSVYTGEPATYTVTITPGAGFNLPVTLSCTQLPANTTCAFSTPTLTGGGGWSNLIVQTSAPVPLAAVRSSARGKIAVLAGLFLLFIPSRLRRNGRRAYCAFTALVMVLATISACGAPGPLNGGTPLGAQTIAVTGIASNGSQVLTHSTTVTLNVKSLF
jgi:hypothetical protein